MFELAPSGTESVLHNFNGSPDGARPAAGLLMDAAGNLFGATSTGGSYYQGTVFKLTLPVTYASLINLVNTFVIKPRVTSSMVAKLQGAEAAAAKGDNAVANRKLAAFIHEVSAQSGKSFDDNPRSYSRATGTDPGDIGLALNSFWKISRSR